MPRNDKKNFKNIEKRRRQAEKDDRENIISMDGSYDRRGSGRKPDAARKPDKSIRHLSRRPIEASLLWIIVFVLFIVYIAGYAYAYMTRGTVAETYVALGTLDSPVTIDGVIIRDETVYKSGADGVAVYNASELTKVKKGDAVCSVEDAATVAELENELRQVDLSILGLQSGGDNSLFSSDIKKANQSLKTIIDNMSFKRTPSDISQLYSLTEKVKENMDYRNNIALNANVNAIKQYTVYKSLVSGQLDAAKETVTADSSGIFSTYSDSLEENYTFDTMAALSKERTVVKAEAVNLADVKNITDGSPIFRIVNSNYWYIAAYIPSNLIGDWELNDLVTIYVQNGDVFSPLDARVHKIVTTSDDGSEKYVLLECTKYMMDYINYRGVAFMVKQGVTEGYKIPKASVVEKTLLKIPEECVFVSNGNNVVIKRTTIGSGYKDENITVTLTSQSGGDDGFDYVLQDYNKLRVGDVLMVVGKPAESRTITDIVNVQGVYLTDSGSAVFTPVVISGGYSSKSEYVILDPAENTNIQIHDRIVADIKYISENQLVY